MNALGGGRKRGDDRKKQDDPSKFPVMKFRFDRYCPYCRKRIPNMALRKTNACPFCKKPMPLRPRAHIAIREPKVIRCQDCDCICLISQNYCELCGWKTPTGEQTYEMASIIRRRTKEQERILLQASCSVESAQHQQQQEQQQDRLNQRQLQLDRQRERQLRVEQELEQQRQQLEEERIRQLEAALLRDDDQAAIAISNLVVQNQDSDEDMGEPEQ